MRNLCAVAGSRVKAVDLDCKLREVNPELPQNDQEKDSGDTSGALPVTSKA